MVKKCYNNKMRHCKDCEPAQEIHWIAYSSVLLGMISEPFFGFLELFFKNTAEAISSKISFPFYRLMVSLGLGHYSYEPDEKDTWRTKCFWEEAKRRGIKMYEFHLGPIRDIFIAEYKGKKITFDGLPRPEVSAQTSHPIRRPRQCRKTCAQHRAQSAAVSVVAVDQCLLGPHHDHARLCRPRWRDGRDCVGPRWRTTDRPSRATG